MREKIGENQNLIQLNFFCFRTDFRPIKGGRLIRPVCRGMHIDQELLPFPPENRTRNFPNTFLKEAPCHRSLNNIVNAINSYSYSYSKSIYWEVFVWEIPQKLINK
jgi:hypothetical protein